ncbi:hypothetical protein NE237_024439 [Protea cynaroides]|uniref:Uncharacterized protein n=1 Tax=Protea cynaroides TaxID=273540 RepID=A0A9Q0HEV8_9MAGN|nr:hypothetical protein NE237_024439 [Protea cynaroides]
MTLQAEEALLSSNPSLRPSPPSLVYPKAEALAIPVVERFCESGNEAPLPLKNLSPQDLQQPLCPEYLENFPLWEVFPQPPILCPLHPLPLSILSLTLVAPLRNPHVKDRSRQSEKEDTNQVGGNAGSQPVMDDEGEKRADMRHEEDGEYRVAERRKRNPKRVKKKTGWVTRPEPQDSDVVNSRRGLNPNADELTPPLKVGEKSFAALASLEDDLTVDQRSINCDPNHLQSASVPS